METLPLVGASGSCQRTRNAGLPLSTSFSYSANFLFSSSTLSGWW